MILISETYEIVTDESAEYGDAADRGFNSECEELTFRELVEKMREFPEPSSGGKVNHHTWFSSYAERDFRTGEEETRSIHFHRDNSPKMEKYWIKAAKAAKCKSY